MAAAERDEAEAMSGLIRGLGRAFGGALIFGLPMLMTNEFWELGAEMSRLRLVILMAASVPLLVGVAHRVGFEATFGWHEDLRDAGIALGIGLLATALILVLFNLVDAAEAPDVAAGRIAVQGVPAALGAMLARSQFGATDEEDEGGERALDGYFGALFMMVVGSLFLSLNIAPTEEVIQIAYTMTPWHALATVVLTVAVMHAFVYGQGVSSDDDGPGWGDFLRFTLVGYLLALAICLATLWLFGRIDGIGTGRLLMTVIVLAFPGGLGAAAARRAALTMAAARTPDRIEWALGFASGAVVLALAGYLLFDGLTGAQALPELRAEILPAGPGGNDQLRFVLHNDGGQTATAVALALLLRDAAGTTVSERRLVIDYLPGHSEATGGFVLPEGTARLRPELVVEGYLDP